MFGSVYPFPSLRLKRSNLKCNRDNLPSLDGVTALLDAGLAGVGDAAGTGMATDSVGTVPACGEDRAGPAGVFPTLLCLGDLGLCVLGDNLGTRINRNNSYPITKLR